MLLTNYYYLSCTLDLSYTNDFTVLFSFNLAAKVVYDNFASSILWTICQSRTSLSHPLSFSQHIFLYVTRPFFSKERVCVMDILLRVCVMDIFICYTAVKT